MSLISSDTAATTLGDAATTADVDAAVMEMTRAGGVPDYIAKNFWRWVEITGGGHTLRILAAPTCYALGDEDAPFFCARGTPYGAQAIADYWDCILPSRVLLRHIQKASDPAIHYIDVKGAPYSIPLAKIETPAATQAASDAANARFASLGDNPGDGLSIGFKKSIVVGPNLDGSHVAIYGGIGGSYDPPWNVVQPYSTIHGSSYGDYSHGITLVSRKAELDGEAVDLRMDVFGSTDPAIYGLVTDQGRFDPVFPNAGPKSIAEFSGGAAAPSGPRSTGGGFGGGAAKNPAYAKPASGGLSTPAKIGIALGVGGAAWYFLG